MRAINVRGEGIQGSYSPIPVLEYSDRISHFKGEKRFACDISDLGDVPGFFGGILVFRLRNPRTDGSMVFNLQRIETDGSGEDVYGWRYIGTDGYRFLIIND